MLDVRIKVRLQMFDVRCPSCASGNIRPSLVRPWVEGRLFRSWLFLSLRRPYICSDCDERFYSFRRRSHQLAEHEEEIASILQEYAPETSAGVSAAADDQKQGKTA